MTTEPTKRSRGRPKTFDRDHTLDVALDGYWREGIDSLSLNEICRRANISKPGLYREFGSEDELLDEVLTRYHSEVLAPTMAMLSADRPFWETLEILLDFAVGAASPDAPRGCLFVKMRTAREHLGPITGKHVDTLRDKGIAVYAEWLDRSAERGDITLPASLELVATYVDAQMVAVLTRIAAGDDPGIVRAHAELALSILQ